MAVNALIAQGVRPIGEDIPQVLNQLQREKQQQFQNSLATDQNNRANALLEQQQGQYKQQQRQAGDQVQQQHFGVLLDALDQAKGTPQYGALLQHLQAAPPEAHQWAASHGIDVASLADPGNIAMARAAAGIAAPTPKTFAGSEYGNYSLGQDGKVTELVKPSPGSASAAAGIQEYNAAKQGGFNGSYIDFMKAKAQAGNVVTPSYSQIPLGDGTYGVLNSRTGKIDPTGKSAPATGANKPSDVERTAANYYDRMVRAEGLLGTAAPSVKDFVAFNQVINGGATAASLGNAAMSEGAQKYYQAASDWVRAKLRKESGAVIGPQEMAQEIRTYFPMPGDGQAVIEQKRQSRATATEGMKGMAGPASAPKAPGRVKFGDLK